MKRVITIVVLAALLLPAADAQAQVTTENREAGEKYNNALALFRQGQYQQSLALALEAAKLEPGNYTAHYLAGLNYKALRDADGAIAQYEAAIRANPNYYSAIFALGKIYEDFKNDVAKAIENYKKSGEVSDSVGHANPKAYQSLAVLLMRQQEWDAAANAWQKVTQQEPTNEIAWDGLGQIFLAKGDYALALVNFRKAQQAQPAWFEPFWHQADVLNRMGQSDEAIKLADEALSRQPGHGGALYEKGLGLKNLEKWDEAIKVLEQSRRDGTWRAMADHQIDLIKNRDKYVIPPLQL